MKYVAVSLCSNGGVVRDQETLEVLNEEIGDFDSFNEAIAHACLRLQCAPLRNGWLTRGHGKGGYLVVTTQELEEV